jgi:hypothetical protein
MDDFGEMDEMSLGWNWFEGLDGGDGVERE